MYKNTSILISTISNKIDKKRKYKTRNELYINFLGENKIKNTKFENLIKKI